MKYGFVYIWYDRKHKRYYIGSHWGREDDGYICSSPWMKRAYAKRPYDFRRRIVTLIYTNRRDMFDEEARWQSMIRDEELRVRYYNIKRHGDNHWSADPLSHLNVKQKLSNTAKENHNDPEWRANYIEGLKTRDNKSSDPAVREKRRQSMIEAMAKKFPKEERVVRAKKGSPEHSAKMRDAANRRWCQKDK